MALVMLPCELPWWGTLQKHLNRLSTTKNTIELIEGMQKIHEMCNISLDPDEDTTDPQLFVGLLNFLDNDLTCEERSIFLHKTLPNIVNRAICLKQWKPGGGLHFSLQQQPDSTDLEYNFISSLLANAFFSTFPKRTERSHPTLQDYNFTHFFKHLDTNSQKAKLKSLLYYFDWLETNPNSESCIKVSRQVMSSREWLTIEDWLECSLPLCPLKIKHEGRLERSEESSLHICFSSSKIGSDVLAGGQSQECITMCTHPELLAILLNVEALEDNEVLMVENVRHISRIVDSKNKACLEKIEAPSEVTICCVDAEDYTNLPISQYEEDNILRELNKCLLAFQQKQCKITPKHRPRRLSPIGESMCSTPPECCKVQQKSRSASPKPQCDNNNMLNNRRGRFIVLGSSGECLPVNRKPGATEEKAGGASLYSSCDSSEDEFHSAKASMEDDSGEEDHHKRYTEDLETPERRHTFAQRLRDALRRDASSVTSSSDSSYAVGISVAGCDVDDPEVKLRRGGSRGFMLQEESLDEEFLKDSLMQERQWIDNFKSKQTTGGATRKDTNRSSEYSFSTEFSSELEEVYEQFSRWLEDPILETNEETKRQLDARDMAVVKFAGALLKRTLSESFAGVPLTDGCGNASGINADDNSTSKKNKLVLNARSLSLELAKQKHKLAAQLKHTVPKRKRWVISCVTTAFIQTLEDVSVTVKSPKEKISEIAQKPKKNGLRAIATGNWGCGAARGGHVELKFILQWLAASVAGVPVLTYYTMGHQQLAKLDTVSRILVDRKWTVKELAQTTLKFSSEMLHGKNSNVSLFEELIGGVFERTI